MTKIHNEITINAPVDKVWNVLADLEQVQYYNPLVAHTKYISLQKDGVNAARHCDFKPSGFSKERITEWKLKEMIGFEVVESSWPLTFCRWKTYLIPDGKRTRVLQDLEYQVKFGIAGRLMDLLLMKKKFNQIMEDIFNGLKEYIESK